MKLKYFLLLLFLSFYNHSFSCDCNPIDRENRIEIGLKKSEIVFYGDLIQNDSVSKTYTFRVIEIFKGKINSQFIKGKYRGSCSLFPQVKQLWIVYANYRGDKIIDMSVCSPSRGFSPYEGSYPPPLPKTYSDTKDKQIQSLLDEIYELRYKKDNLEDWIYQLERLRTYKALENQKLEKEKTDSKIETYSQYIIISLIVNILLFAGLLFFILKKRI